MRLDRTNHQDFSPVMTSPIWQLMNTLPMFQQSQTSGLNNSLWLEERVVNIPSGLDVSDTAPNTPNPVIFNVQYF